jgi:hypothetical protein
VGGVERIRDLDACVQPPLRFHGTIAKQVLQGRTIEKFHDGEGLTQVRPDFVDRAQVLGWFIADAARA